jgi:nicotinate-nucleotide adenylyltransferase
MGKTCDKIRKIGVFGGTFDPVHEGHIGIADLVLERGIVDRIIFVPALNPPHKNATQASFADRVAMLDRALAGRGNMAVSTIEKMRSGPSYTLHTIQALQDQYPDARLVFLMGADSLLDFQKWYRFKEILNSADLLVLARPGIDEQSCSRAILELPGRYTRVSNSDGLVVHADEQGNRLYYFCPKQSWPVSSTDIREELASGGTPMGGAAQVLAYIHNHHLYGT